VAGFSAESGRFIDTIVCRLPPATAHQEVYNMAKKEKIINLRVCFDGDREASEVFAEVIAAKIRNTETKDNLAVTTDSEYNNTVFSNLKSA
jgi:predicted RNA-binding protein with PIN domain